MWNSRVNPDGPIDPEAIKIHKIRPADLTGVTASSTSAIQPMQPGSGGRPS